MARALLLACACACAVAAAAAARYGDYAAVKMPQYGADYDAPAAASDDYRDHSPDASASLDYKYVEEPSDKIEKTLSNDVEEEDAWKKPVKKIRKQKSVDDGDPVALNKYKLDEVAPKFKTSYRNKNKDWYRNKSKVTADKFSNRRFNPDHNIDDDSQKLDFDDEESQTQHDDFQEEKNSEHEKSKFVRREIRKKARRKPRDRPTIDTRVKLGSSEDDENMSDVRDIQKTLRGKEPIYPDVEERPWVPIVPAPAGRPKSRPRVLEEDEEDVPRVAPPKPQPIKSYNDYADYYDMQRVQNIKNKLPPLLRRTKAREMELPSTEIYTSSWRPRQPFYRRKNISPETTTYIEDATTTSSATAAPATRSFTTTAFVVTAATLAKSIVTAEKSHEISLAEKSRLSILRKSQRKERFRDRLSSKKPPVLLQVTERMHTVVMVEPPIAKGKVMRAEEEYEDDTPERLARIKRLMKRKLIANAKSVRDLTDNWDDVICEYVDVAQIDALSPSQHADRHAFKSDSLILFGLPALYLLLII